VTVRGSTVRGGPAVQVRNRLSWIPGTRARILAESLALLACLAMARGIAHADCVTDNATCWIGALCTGYSLLPGCMIQGDKMTDSLSANPARTDVCLVTMPYDSLSRPSMALGLLKAILVAEGLDVSVAHANIWFAEA